MFGEAFSFLFLTMVFVGLPGTKAYQKVRVRDLRGAVIPIVVGVVLIALLSAMWVTA